jgi:hypothetical protein
MPCCFASDVMQRFREAGKDPEVLSEAERFLLMLADTPRAGQRLSLYKERFLAQEKHATAMKILQVGGWSLWSNCTPTWVQPWPYNTICCVIVSYEYCLGNSQQFQSFLISGPHPGVVLIA